MQATGLRLGSPATGTGDDTNPNGWLAQFMAQIKSHGYRVDFICIHPYQSNFNVAQATTNLQNEIEYVHNTYGLPIWATEYAMANWSNGTTPDNNTAAQFATSSAAMMDSLPYVERYAWYSMIPNQGGFSLQNSDGSLTVIGSAWAGAAGGWTPIANGNHTLTPQNATGSLLDAAGSGTANGTAVDIWQTYGSPNQTWTFTNEGGNVYKIQPSYDLNLCLDVIGGGGSGTDVDLWADNGGSNQRWAASQVSGGIYTFSPLNSPGSCLDVVGGKTANGTLVDIWTANGGKNQHWAVH